jgi:hypothetical protein
MLAGLSSVSFVASWRSRRSACRACTLGGRGGDHEWPTTRIPVRLPLRAGPFSSRLEMMPVARSPPAPQGAILTVPRWARPGHAQGQEARRLHPAPAERMRRVGRSLDSASTSPSLWALAEARFVQRHSVPRFGAIGLGESQTTLAFPDSARVQGVRCEACECWEFALTATKLRTQGHWSS